MAQEVSSISFHTILKVSREIGNNGRLLGEPKYNLPSFGNTIIDSRSLPLAYSHHRIKQNLESNPNVLCDFPSCNNESNSEITRLVCFDTCHLNFTFWELPAFLSRSKIGGHQGSNACTAISLLLAKTYIPVTNKSFLH
ncbi:uncharacterized protein [Pocillopora verrucosa]|uniref:uncharacterized protein n=1 Tax=Pocillopora verrucosa TaxID=203993 RepID=UPI003342B04A